MAGDAGGFPIQRGFLNFGINEAPPVTVASAATMPLGPLEANTALVTGTTTIVSLGVWAAGAVRRARFAGALTLTHNATSLFLPNGGSNITTAANDTAVFVSLGNGNWYCDSYIRASGAPLVGAQFWTETRSTAAPNNIINAAIWTPNVVSANGDAVIQIKAGGAFLTNLPDSTSVGGDKRGANAFDGSSVRNAATEVGSGDYSTNFGKANTASGVGSTCSGGESNVASGPQATSGGGQGNVVNGDYGNIPGGLNASLRGVYGARAFSSGSSSTVGDAQESAHVFRRGTTDATPTILTSSGSSASATTTGYVPSNSVRGFTVYVVGYKDATQDFARFKIEGVAHRAGSNSTAVAGVVSTTIHASAGAGAWAVTVVANTGNDCFEVQVTGVAATVIRWVARVQTEDVA